MGRHAAVAGSPVTAPLGAVALEATPARRRAPRTAPGHDTVDPSLRPLRTTTGSLTRAGIAAALVTASAAAVAGSTGTFPSLSDTDVASTGTNLLSVSSPDAAAVPAPRAATVAPVSLAAAPAAAPAVKSVSPAQKAAAAQEKAAQDKATQEKAATTKKQAAEKKSAAAAPASLGSLGERIVAQASEFKGVPYEWGGTTPSGFDCSGLTKYVFGKMGISLPRTAQQQYDKAQHISQSQAQPGDLVFMGGENSIYHVAIYAGGGKMWTAPETGQSVKLGNLFGDYSFGRIR
ncbi:C40 family peptidase [Actinomycetospora soli]|uniref:C40 family peptidase n=1 Tax=Actinomycetospora soli TaxID=2893887 RepID=UPI001E45EC57|nr:C40 family peptidase [Actinomycetospora soli]MCD2187987.1 C40 family peptidase [Actinomycetospora soli]